MEHFLTFLKGFAMGAANVIPGVSGGTIAFITGIYERLIDALKSFDFKAIRYLLKFDFRSFAKHVDLSFLVALGLGVVTSILTLAKLLKEAYGVEPVWVNAFFFGLITASIFAVGKMVRNWSGLQIVRCFVFQAEDGIRDAQKSRGLGDVYERRAQSNWVYKWGDSYSCPYVRLTLL